MSTRSQIKVIDSGNSALQPVMLYHHHDGYVEGVGYNLFERFYDAKTGKMNMDDVDRVVYTLVKDTDDEYEVTVYNHTDIEYLYVVDVYTKKITCYEVNNWDGDMKVNQTFDHDAILYKYRKDNGIEFPAITNEQVKVIHTIVTHLGWEHSKYVDLMLTIFNVTTCKDLTNHQAEKFISILNKIQEI